jgi:hypothetical protein
MKSTSLIFAFILSANFVFGQNAPEEYFKLVKQADSLYKAKDYKKSNAIYKLAFKIEKKNSSDLYNAACSAALAGDRNSAFDFLVLAVQYGWTNIDHLKSDSDLDRLHKDKKWTLLVERMQQKVDSIEANYDKPLQRELLEILDEDQTIRNEYMSAAEELGWDSPAVDSLGKIMMYKDSINLIKVTKILDERGWVGQDKIGHQANQALFLVIQHSDLTTQEKYLPMMREAVKNGNARGSSLALLEDRVALGQGKRQIYGSQIGRDPETQAYYVLPLEDPDNVDARRAAVGLGTLAEYISYWQLEWDVEQYKKDLPMLEEKAKRE